jgi:phospholipid/cholesterol/gamma-HCH transport system substrate-binding protein
MRLFRPLHERDQAVVAIVGTAVIALVVLLAMNLSKVPFLHPTTSYRAEFASADGLTSGADVRIAGITVGSVSSVKVRGDHVEVTFHIKKGLHLGGQSTASIEIATVLGQEFLQITSTGSGTLSGGGAIPLSRTTVPYTLLDALGKFGQTEAATNLPQLRTALDQLAAALGGTAPKDVTATLDGLAKLTSAIASRQDELATLLTSARQITDTLNAHASDFVGLLTDSDTFLQLLEQRRDAIAALLNDTAALGAQVDSLIRRDGANLAPLLDNLKTVTSVLAHDQTQLTQAVTTLGEFSKNIANVTGSGPWIDLLGVVQFEPDNVIKACGTHPSPDCGR